MKAIGRWLKQLFCRHRFDYSDLVGRTEPDGCVTWHCWKCDKTFEACCGLDILWHGKVEAKPEPK